MNRASVFASLQFADVIVAPYAARCERLSITYSYVLRELYRMLLAAELTGEYDRRALRDMGRFPGILCARRFESMHSPIAGEMRFPQPN